MRTCTVSALLATLLVALMQTGSALAADTGNTAQHDLLAEVEIARLATTYAWAVDAKDIDTLMTIFSRDAQYDLGAYGRTPATGHAAIRNVFIHGVFPSEKCSFSSISNLRVQINGNEASGGDYFIHFGYNPQQGEPGTRTHVEGQHLYRFVKEDGAWKISWMQGQPNFESSETIQDSQLRNLDCRSN